MGGVDGTAVRHHAAEEPMSAEEPAQILLHTAVEQIALALALKLKRAIRNHVAILMS